MKPFIRKKARGDKSFYYIVTNSRVKGRVKQQVIAYLGEQTSIANRKRWLLAQMRRLSNQVQTAKRELKTAEEYFSERNKGAKPRLPKRGETSRGGNLNTYLHKARLTLTKLESAHARLKTSMVTLQVAIDAL